MLAFLHVLRTSVVGHWYINMFVIGINYTVFLMKLYVNEG